MCRDLAIPQPAPIQQPTPQRHAASSGDAQATSMLGALAAFCDTPFASTQDAIHTGLDLVMEFVGVRTAFIAQVHTNVLAILDAHDHAGCNIPGGTNLPLDNTFCQYVRATDVPIIIRDAAHDARVVQLPVRLEFRIGAYLGVPLRLNDGTLFGTLCALDPDPQDFGQTQVELMRIIGQRLAASIEHEQIQRMLLQAGHDAEDDIQASLTMLDQQTTVLHVVAHDLRTPLTSIRGFSGLLSAGVVGPVSEPQRKLLDRINISAQWMNRLVNDVLDVASIESQTFALLIDTYHPAHVARQVLDMCQPEAARKGITLVHEFAPDLPTVVGDSDRVQQALLNFMSNALRYTLQGSIGISVQADNDSVLFRVSDTGPGIAPEQIAQIWQRHTRATTIARGLGLGLYIVQALVEAMHGSVGVESVVDQGSTFWMRLPLQGPQPQTVSWKA